MSDDVKERLAILDDTASENERYSQQKLQMPDWLRSLAKAKDKAGNYTARWLLVHMGVTHEARLRVLEIVGGTETGFVRHSGHIRRAIRQFNKTGDLEGEIRALNSRINPMSLRDVFENGYGYGGLTDDDLRLLTLRVDDKEKKATMLGMTVDSMEQRISELVHKHDLFPNFGIVVECRKRLAEANRRRATEKRRKANAQSAKKSVTEPMSEITIRDRIIEAAIEYIDLNGEENLRFPEIARHVGITLDELRSYFPKRDKLIEAMQSDFDSPKYI